MITDDHTPLLCHVYVWISTASIFSRHLCSAPIGRETGHSSCQSIFILNCILNPSDDMGDQLAIVVISSTDRAGSAPLFICQGFCAYRVLSDPFTCIVWECGPIWIFKVTGDIWYINSIFMFAAAPYTSSLDVPFSNSSASHSTSFSATSDIETSTSSAETVSNNSSINTTLSEAAWWRVGRRIESLNQCIQVSGCFEKCGRMWWPTNVDFCLQICVWWHNLV